MTIDELAHRTGLTTRNVRAYHSRGLLPPPEVRGRTGYYGEEHAARLELIRQMQAEGFNLTAIKRLLDGAGGSLSEVLGLQRAAVSGFSIEEPEVTTAEQLAERFGEESDQRFVDRAVELDVLAPLGDDRYEVRSPALLDAGEKVVSLGIPLEVALDLAAEILDDSEAIATAFIRMFLDQVVKPFYDAGAPAEEATQVREALEQLRPIAGQAVSAGFALRMAAAAEEAFGRVLAGEEWPGDGEDGRDDGRGRSSRSRRRAHQDGRRRRGAGPVR
jgi:DNA-binding transcriptional MerR regulator